MSKKTNKSGVRKHGARNAILIVIILAVLGALGYFVWTNFIQKSTTNTKTVAVVTKSKTFTYSKSSLSFNYPSDWVIADDAKSLNGTLTSPDGNVTLTYGAVTIDTSDSGGCSVSTPGDSYTITGLTWETVPSISNVIVSQLSTKYVSGASTYYHYQLGLVNDSDNSFRSAKTGDDACKIDKITTGLIQPTIDIDGSTYYLSFHGVFKDLDANAATLTQAQIDKDFASSDATTARDILKSASIK
jgi:hypothetical protein